MVTIALAAAWNPRGELKRLLRFYPRLLDLYSEVCITLPHETDADILGALAGLDACRYDFYEGWSGRHRVVQMALQNQTEFIQYIDMDRLIRWVETHPDELRATVQAAHNSDCLIIGRTPAAYATHPASLIETEALVNTVFSPYFGREMDFCAGSKILSHRAAVHVLAHSPQDSALRMDVEWALLLHRAGFVVDYVEVEGMDWETADQFEEQAAGPDRQARLAAEYDQQAENWRLRTRVAHDILKAGLAVMNLNPGQGLSL